MDLTQKSNGAKIGLLMINGFTPRPSLPNYIKNDSKYQVIANSDVGLTNIASLLTTQGFLDAKAIKP